MKKLKFALVSLLVGGASLLMSSCVGSFALTHSVLNWNKNVGGKFVNELVFVAFWILPVYEVSAIADLLVVNSIEFWSGKNPVATSYQMVDTDHGKYIIEGDEKGYTITHQPTGQQTRLDYDAESATWAAEIDGTSYPFMTFIDDSHVKMITPEGDFRIVELSEQGVMAYREGVAPLMADNGR